MIRRVWGTAETQSADPTLEVIQTVKTSLADHPSREPVGTRDESVQNFLHPSSLETSLIRQLLALGGVLEPWSLVSSRLGVLADEAETEHP